MSSERTDVLYGTLALLILKTLATADLHGWDIAKRIAIASSDRLTLKQGSLYPALHRLTRQGFITSSWRVTENSRRARYYALTAAGRRALTSEHTSWERLSQAVNLIMRMTPG